MDDEIVEDLEDDSSDDPDDTAFTEPADEIIPFLQQANYSVIVALEYPNKAVDNTDDGIVKAFAKIAGKDWTYYVNDASINIGRSPDSSNRQSVDLAARSSPGQTAEDIITHIDLGPSKHVSRLHAELSFKSEDERWHIMVSGRNGVRVNDTLLKRSQHAKLSSGDVIEIAGTEMIFVSPDVRAVIYPKYRARLEGPVREEQLHLWDNQAHAHPGLPPMVEPALTHAMAAVRPFTNGAPIIAPAPSNFARPSTPIKSPTKAPRLLPPPKSSPVYGQGLIMDNNNEQIDFSSDAMKEVKPPCSYATLIAQAILAAPGEKSSLSDIYKYIRDNFSYYRHMDRWDVSNARYPCSAMSQAYAPQNSIRHNLSLNSAFQKVARESHEPGKGCKWFIVPEKKEELRNSGLKMTSRGGARRNSGPNSPARKRSPKDVVPPISGSITSLQALQTSPTAHTPTLGTYPIAQESFTPTRGSRVPVLGHSESQLPQLSDDASPLPARPYLSKNAAVAGSPPTLSSSAYDDQQPGYNLFTPAPQRHEPRLMAPSTAKLPSQYLPQSSPAPFWRLNGAELGSTPAKFPESSPLKAAGRTGIASLQSSSPPPAVANGSPTRARNVPGESGLSGPTEQSGLGIRNGRVHVDEDDDDDDTQLDLMA